MADDLLDKLVAQLRAAAPDFPEDKLLEAAKRVRRDLGGTEHYVRKDPAAGKAQRLGEQLAAGVPLAQAFELAQVSRAQGYRLLSRRFRLR